MKIVLLNGSSTPIYEQIMNAIKENVKNGTLSAEAQLPSVRQLSRELGISILTVKKAYDGLEAEGFIVVRQGLGTFVAPMDPNLLREEKQKEVEASLTHACQVAKTIDLGETELVALLQYIYEGDACNEPN
ncbi:MAG: GntR family transcriptional regulator [Oscillospiraceae bacterium]|nr:GntR family transcriptional regulator [Oscillospiraceae bacterium]